jgi:predicted RNA-binding Zn-ribbon protein involved in translation (DUF1610 family)
MEISLCFHSTAVIDDRNPNREAIMFILFWIGFCAIPAIIASNKGRSAAGWFFGSLFISPLLGAIIVACLHPLTGELEQRAVSSGEMRKCPHCAELVKAEAKICRYCQRELPVAFPSLFADSGPKPMQDLSSVPDICPSCNGTILTIEAGKFYRCPKCQQTFTVISPRR